MIEDNLTVIGSLQVHHPDDHLAFGSARHLDSQIIINHREDAVCNRDQNDAAHDGAGGRLSDRGSTGACLQAAQADMAREEVNARWQALMAPYFENLGGSYPDQGLIELVEVFHTD